MGGILLMIFILSIVTALVWLGYQLAYDRLADDRAALDDQRDALDAEWHALENGRRVGEVFFSARNAMRREADRHTQPVVIDGDNERR